MKRLTILIGALLILSAPVTSAQEQGVPNTDDMIATQIKNLNKMFTFDDIQLFYIDSILQANIPALMNELQSLRQGGAANTETYMVVSDKWMDATDKAFEKVFTEEQWARYLKSPYGKDMKKREKRMAERAEATKIE